ncbi:MAG: hypothetical protein HQK54_14055, partial [Oligoflexales bacterium]|nr:hypothetical protein [Oligoflexales bacterium]
MRKNVTERRLNFHALKKFFIFPALLCPVIAPNVGHAVVHSAPVIIPAFKIRGSNLYSISKYGLYATSPSGEAFPVPFQIDEINKMGDFVLDQGPSPNIATGNGIFDMYDELAFMGNDIGPSKPPEKWPFKKPDILYEIKFANHSNPGIEGGSVFLGVHLTSEPTKTNYKYVVFDKEKGNVTTSRYYYEFDTQNYLMTKKVDMISPKKDKEREVRTPIIDSSVFYLRADLKYFLTVRANHRSVNSQLDAYKSGPVRTIVRVNFYYVVLKLNFRAGMYTEVSFFSNSVILPAVIDNPINPKTTLNDGSGFYYGFVFRDNPLESDFTTNMKLYPPKMDLFEMFMASSTQPDRSRFWLCMMDKSKMIYLELKLSKKMYDGKNYPFLYTQNLGGAALPRYSDQNSDLAGL